MSDVSQTSMDLSPARAASASGELRRTMLRQAVNEVVGVTFFGEMLRTARNSRLKGELGHGGRGEDIFGGQLDMELARRVGQGMKNSLSEAMFERYAKRV